MRSRVSVDRWFRAALGVLTRARKRAGRPPLLATSSTVPYLSLSLGSAAAQMVSEGRAWREADGGRDAS